MNIDRRLILGLATVIAVFIIFTLKPSLFSDRPDDHPKADAPASSIATPSPSARPPIAVTATELFQAFDENEARAQARFGDGPLLVTGTISSIGLGFGDVPQINLVTPNPYMHAHADLVEADANRAVDLDKGETITLLCRHASVALGSPMLDDCTIRN